MRPRPTCVCCGSTRFDQQAVLWPALVAEWRLAPAERDYIDRREGRRCADCGCNLRSQALAQAILDLHGVAETLRAFCDGPGQALRVLEINEAGGLTPFLARIPGHRLAKYPEVDLHALPFAEGSFDLVVHSDTLEHVARPVVALAECRRVLAPGGACAFTVPIIVDRLSLSREGMPPSFHANEGERDPAMRVRTEYGADAWRQVIEAGFPECRLVALEHPAAIALLGVTRREAAPTIAPAPAPVPAARPTEAEVLARPWFYEFDLPSGARTASYLPPDMLPIHETRRRILMDVLEPEFGDRWPATSCLDLACHEGWFAVALAQRGCGRVLGIDAREENLAGARQIRDLLGLPNLELRRADVTEMDPTAFGSFDAVLILGLLYHLEDPVGALRLARALTRRVCVIETQFAPSLTGTLEWGTRTNLKAIAGSFAVIDETAELQADNREANTTSISVFPDLPGLLWLLKAVGFTRAGLLVPHPGAHEQLARGARGMVAAWVD
jgi:2-polyprenyl-3-methyl-5-hydroxy-6-metoxy-1,4-benzoquinol methylase